MTLEREQTTSCRDTYTSPNTVCYRTSVEHRLANFLDIVRGACTPSQVSSSSPPLSLSSASLTRPTSPAPLFSFRTFPASESLDANAFRAPRFAPTSQICSFAFDPAAAIVSGSSGEKTAENTLPCYFREMTAKRRAALHVRCRDLLMQPCSPTACRLPIAPRSRF